MKKCTEKRVIKVCGFSTYETNRPASVWLDAQAFDLHRVVFCVDLITHKLPGSWQSGDHDLWIGWISLRLTHHSTGTITIVQKSHRY